MKKNINKGLKSSFHSDFNGEIELKTGKGGYSLTVDGFIQSGAYMEGLWNGAFEELVPKMEINNILLLGFGAGSIVAPIKSRWPKCFIRAVEIDPVMIEIARKYFPENTNGVDIVNSDAIEFLRSLPKKLSFDLIVVDCYIGGAEPEDIKTIDFLLNLKKVSKWVLLNQIFLPLKQSEMKRIEFLKDLDTYYPVKILKLPYNIIIEF